MFRRFGTLYTRNLLYLQAEIVDLEGQLVKLDFTDAASPENTGKLVMYPQGRNFNTNQARAELCELIRHRLKEYSKRLTISCSKYREL
jgi:hypothetical protein